MAFDFSQRGTRLCWKTKFLDVPSYGRGETRVVRLTAISNLKTAPDTLNSPPSGNTAQNTTRYPFSTPCSVILGGSAHVITASSEVTEMARTFWGGWLGTEDKYWEEKRWGYKLSLPCIFTHVSSGIRYEDFKHYNLFDLPEKYAVDVFKIDRLLKSSDFWSLWFLNAARIII